MESRLTALKLEKIHDDLDKVTEIDFVQIHEKILDEINKALTRIENAIQMTNDLMKKKS